MIELKKGRYHSQFWFLGGRDDLDVFGALSRDLPDGKWEIMYRFRYHDGSDKDPFEDQDEKSWSAWVSNRDEAESLAFAGRIFRDLAVQTGMDLYVIPAHTDDVDQIITTLDREPWFHRRPDAKECP